jgi:5-methylcytosine-specific restriction endonuclease McrA
MQRVFVLSKTGKPLMPCHPARARELLRNGSARVSRRYPFTIQLNEREDGVVQEMELKVCPGSKASGLALVGAFKRGRRVLFAANIEHRGQAIRDALLSRRSVRRSRRNRKTRYRAARFLNRRRPKGWLAPSLRSRVENVRIWSERLLARAPISGIAAESMRFDTQKIMDPEIRGVEYQQGELFGYEVREYLLEKWKRTCAYCDAQNVPLEIDHIVARSRGGSERVSNLTLACHRCNQRKGSRPVEEFVKDKRRLRAILSCTKESLQDVAALNSTRFALVESLKSSGIPVSCWSAARTKANRMRQGYKKDKWIDAACTGESGSAVFIAEGLKALQIKSDGRGSRQKCAMDRYGFPRTAPKARKRVHGFQTGDMVKAVITKGKHTGIHVGRVVIRSRGFFTIRSGTKKVDGVGYGYCRSLQKVDGYSYAQ